MERIIAAEFDTFDQAQQAGRVLRGLGLESQDLQIFYLKPGGQHAQYPIGGDRTLDKAARGGGLGAILGVVLGAVLGIALGWWLLSMTSWPQLLLLAFAALGAYIGAMVGGIVKLGGHKPEKEPLNRVSGVMLAARLGSAEEAVLVRELQRNGGYAIEWANGNWSDGQWQDFNPTRTPQLYDLPSAGQKVHETRSG
ncbi:hypothetical protein PQ786_10645 [Alcaligenes faecalis]